MIAKEQWNILTKKNNIAIRHPEPDITIERVLQGLSKMQKYMSQRQMSNATPDFVADQIDMQFDIVISLMQALNNQIQKDQPKRVENLTFLQKFKPKGQFSV